MASKLTQKITSYPLNRYRVDLPEFIETVGNKYFLLYLIKCLLGASACFWLYQSFPNHQYIWSLVSVILVIAPEDKDSIKFSLNRIEANIIGATIGMVYYIAAGINLLTLLLSILTTIAICTLFRLGNSTRTALAAVIIVTVLERERGNWHIALERMLSVFIGCMIGVIITLVFYMINRSGKHVKSEDVAE